jgi:methionyl-tRNA formyltransferase
MIFFGTSEFAAGILETLHNHNMSPSLVVTQTDKAVGRKQILAQSPVAAVAERLKIKVTKPLRLNDPAFLTDLRNHKSKIFVVVAYGKDNPAGSFRHP